METRADFIEQRIREAFHDLAEELDADDMAEEQAAGVPHGLFRAEMAMVEAWRRYLNGADGLAGMIAEYYERRGLKWPADADEALDWCLTELAEAKELLLAREGGWVRNNPEAHPAFNDSLLEAELGDIVMMALVAGMVEGLDPLSALAEKMRRA
jgi:hypothetical protein